MESLCILYTYPRNACTHAMIAMRVGSLQNTSMTTLHPLHPKITPYLTLTTPKHLQHTPLHSIAVLLLFNARAHYARSSKPLIRKCDHTCTKHTDFYPTHIDRVQAKYLPSLELSPILQSDFHVHKSTPPHPTPPHLLQVQIIKPSLGTFGPPHPTPS